MIIHRGDRYQIGRGIGSLFGGLFRSLKPLFSMGLSAGKRFLQSDAAKKIGSTALDIGKEAAKNVAVDLLQGKNLHETLDKELEVAKSKIATKLQGGGRFGQKRKTKFKTNIPLKKTTYNLLN